jgi:hypothetical protein
MRRVFLEESSTSVSSRGTSGSITAVRTPGTENGDMESGEHWKAAWRHEITAVLTTSAVRPARHTKFGIITSREYKNKKLAINCVMCMHCAINKNKQKHSKALVRKLTIATERPPFVGEVNANFCGKRVSHGQHNGSSRPYSRLSRAEPLLFLPSSSSVVFTRLNGPCCTPTTTQKIWYRWESNSGPPDL